MQCESSMEHFQQRLKYLLAASAEQTHKNVVKNHLCVGYIARQPKDVVFAESHFKLAVFLYQFYLFLNSLLLTTKTVYYTTCFQLSQSIFGRITQVDAGQFSAKVFAKVGHSRKHKIAVVEIGLVPFGGAVELQTSKHSIDGGVDVNNEVVSDSIFDYSHYEVIFLRHVGGYFFYHISVVFATQVLHVEQSEVKTFWQAVLLVEMALIEHSVFESDWFSGENKFLVVDIQLLLHYIIINPTKPHFIILLIS